MKILREITLMSSASEKMITDQRDERRCGTLKIFLYKISYKTSL